MPPRDAQSPKRRPRQERSRALVDALLEATARVLVDRGLDEATTNQIAEVAGVSVGSLYQYFRDKRGLAAALIERKAERDLAELVTSLATVTDEGLEARVAAMVRATVAMHRRDARLMRALLALVGPTGRVDAVRAIAARGRAEMAMYFAPCLHELRVMDPDLGGFVVGRALEEIVHAVVNERPELFDHPLLEAELTHLVVAYMRA